MYRLKTAAAFEAAHRIDDYPGKCRRLHGHNWSVEVEITGMTLDELGMLVDFKLVKQKLMTVLDKLDHQYLNELPMFAANSPTAENLAKFVFDELTAEQFLRDGVVVAAVSVWESPQSCVTYSPSGENHE